MKKLLTLIIMVFVCVFTFSLDVQATNTNAPYYTYTADSNGNLIKTTEAYTPSKQINKINDQSFELLQHIYVDDEDYIYITDSKAITYVEQIDPETGEPMINPNTGNVVEKRYVGKIIVLDKNYQFVGEIYHDDFSNFITSTFVTKDKIYVVDLTNESIFIFNKEEFIENQKIQLEQTITKPTHPIFQDQYNDEGERVVNGYDYRPEHIVVDSMGNIYVQGKKSKNGLIMLDDDGSFMTFFGGNPLRIPIIDRVRRFFLTEEQEDKLQRETDQKIIHDIPSNIAIDDKGYIYTVTSSIPTNPIKKFNTSGRNFFKKDMIGLSNMTSIWIGEYNNVFAINNQGLILEYDTNGNLLFLFGGMDATNSRAGLLNLPVSIAATSDDNLLVADQANKLIQVYTPTEFTNIIHEAFEAYYNDGDYEESREKWEYILQYNSLFDYAHIGLGNSYMRDNEYHDAYQEYYYANDYMGLSDAYWGIRQDWMRNNLNTVILIIVLLLITRVIYYFLNKKYQYSKSIGERINGIRRKNQLFDEMLYIFRFLKHPFDGFYEIKRENRVSMMTSTFIYLLLGIVIILNYRFTNVVFVPKVGINITYELFILGFILILWVVSNYLVCSINDGEGSIKNVYNATAYSLTPILIIMPFIIVMSHVLTLQEYVFYQFGYLLMSIWTVFLFFFMIKDIHNYSVRKTIGVILKSMFTMLILGLFLFVVFALGNQMIEVVKNIIGELINR